MPRRTRPARRSTLPRLEVLEDRLAPASFSVTNIADSGPGSLRQAILDANNATGGVINIQIIGGGAGTISPASPLPWLANNITIDGRMEGGYTGAPLIRLDGVNAGVLASGLVLTGGDEVSGLAVTRFRTGILLFGGSGSTVTANDLGIDAAGDANVGNTFAGLYLSDSRVDAIGGPNPGTGNVISGNGQYGVVVDDGGHNRFSGNKIGTSPDGNAARANGFAGLVLFDGANSNVVGGSVENGGAGNEISGNGFYGVIAYGQGSLFNSFDHNLIGVDASGAKALGNGLAGVYLQDGASANTFTANTVSGNADIGFLFTNAGNSGANTSGNVFTSNRVGVNAEGTAAVANGYAGFGLGVGVSDNIIGGAGVTSGNVISGNTDYGIFLAGGSGNLVEGNRIGVDASGTAALPNGLVGVFVLGGSDNTVGGAAAGTANVISGNGFDGVAIASAHGSGGGGNLVEGDVIGVNAAGTAALANGFDGVFLYSGTNNTVGGTAAAGTANVISGNAVQGVEIAGGSNLVEGNFIGTNAAGTAALANGQDGVLVDPGATGNTLGGVTAAAANVISGNAKNGVEIDSNGSGNLVEGNRIGTNAAGTARLANGNDGVLITKGASSNTIGGTASGAGNVISGNGSYGVLVLGVSGNLIQDNAIGTLADGSTALANGDDGVFITSDATGVAANNTVSGNTIAFNQGDGVLIGSDATFTTPAGTGNTVTQNSIFGNSVVEGSHTQIGIDLGPDDGVTPNDSAGHVGPNNFQDFPVLTSASASGGNTTVNFTLTVAANVNYRVEFFVSPTADPSGFGQGKTFVGFAVESSGVGGSQPFQVTLPGSFAGQFVTATATDASGNTSEFSNAFQVT